MISVNKNRFLNVQVFLLFMLCFLLGLSEFIMVGVLPQIAHAINVPITAVGNLVSYFAIAYVILAPFGAALSSRFQRFPLLLTLLIFFLSGNMLAAISWNYWSLVVARLIGASVAGTLTAVALTFAPDLVDLANRTRFLAWVYSGFSIAAVLGVPIGSFITNQIGWRVTFWLINVLTILLICAVYVTIPRTSAVVTQNKTNIFTQFKIFTDLRILLACGIVVFGAAGTYSFYTYITPLLINYIHIPKTWSGLGLVVIGLAGLCGNIYSGKLAAQGSGIEPATKLWKVLLAQLLALIIFTLVMNNFIALSLVLLSLSLMMYLQNSPAQVLFVDVQASTGLGSTNLAAALQSIAWNGGIALGSGFASLIVAHIGMRWIGLSGVTFAILALLCVGALGRLKNHLVHA
ncbi:MFS transporter, DHA1 family, arabinose polymer transporter [Weissella oryzae SG25]|uniref:MFS transporter, DHA1 family, arabinose polymer transporter n=1 Tax=Weissella oryzae (strain DSM 25784 / JCM 18191 / LMG 30913 / SG25) TaxID=1329250 RepID=A0A069CVI0_WEIOS|nr:MFS transporter, DHA1 family, arabinose polymer transporter [Weissella oryzae SG25]